MSVTEGSVRLSSFSLSCSPAGRTRGSVDPNMDQIVSSVFLFRPKHRLVAFYLKNLTRYIKISDTNHILDVTLPSRYSTSLFEKEKSCRSLSLTFPAFQQQQPVSRALLLILLISPPVSHPKSSVTFIFLKAWPLAHLFYKTFLPFFVFAWFPALRRNG